MKLRTVRMRSGFGLVSVCCLLLLSGCASIRPPSRGISRQVVMEVTGYCDCGQCCNWKRVWWAPWRTVVAAGPNRGASKTVGLTASGTVAKHGTVAADRHYYPFGTVMEIPGYGMGRVDDTGGALRGPAKIDLFFRSHQQAVEWGRQRLPVKVWSSGP